MLLHQHILTVVCQVKDGYYVPVPNQAKSLENPLVCNYLEIGRNSVLNGAVDALRLLTSYFL